MIKIGILIIEDAPDNRPTLAFFKKVEKKYNAKTVILEAKYINFVFADIKNSQNQQEGLEKKHIYYKNKLIKIDALLPKIESGSSSEDFLLAINIMDFLRNHTDIAVINYTKGMLISNDKFWQGEYIASHGFKTPVTAFITNRDNINEALKYFNRYPLIVKNQYGAGGSGVAIVESERSAKSVISSMLAKNNNVVVQEYLPVQGGTDYRVYVIGGKVVKGIIRRAPEKEFRANVALGGSKKTFIPDKQLSSIAVEIANLVGLDIAAVDFMYYKNQYYFIEINKNPGTKQDSKTAEKMLVYVVERCKKKVKKLIIPSKRYLIKNLHDVRRVFNEIDANFFSVGVKSFDAVIPAFFIDKYGILSYKYTNDLKLINKYSKVKSMQDEDVDYFNYYSSIKTSDNINYATIENYLRKFKNVCIFVYDLLPQIEKIISNTNSVVIYVNKLRIQRRYQNRLFFSQLLEKYKMPKVTYKNYSLQQLLRTRFDKLKQQFGPKLDIYLSGLEQKYVKKTFFIRNEQEYTKFLNTIKSVEYPSKAIEAIHIAVHPKGISISINACVTKNGVLIGRPFLQLINVPEVNNRVISNRRKICGSQWNNAEIITDEIAEKTQKITEKIGRIMQKNSNFSGVFTLDFIYNQNNRTIIPTLCQPRNTESLIVEDLIRVFNNEIPLQTWQLLESTNIKYDFNFSKINKKYLSSRYHGANLYLFNRKNQEIKLTKGIKAGIYEYNKSGRIKFIEENLDFNCLKKDNQFILIESISSWDKTLILEDDKSQILGLIFPKNIYNIKTGLAPEIKKVVKEIYKRLGV